MTASQHSLPIIGWREWLTLPDLEISGLKAKVDTGARSSALHAFDIELFQRQGVDFVRFKVHPAQRSDAEIVSAEAKLLDIRAVRNSGGQARRRPVIQTTVALGGQQWPIELTLTNRDEMGFRMLLGRQAVRQRFLIDAGKSYLQSSKRSHKPKTPRKASL
ncbi:MAG: ATP-dependent zinc protease [Cyanobacteria bacterium P01_A01_bin.114]